MDTQYLGYRTQNKSTMFGWFTANVEEIRKAKKEFPSLELPCNEEEKALWLQHALRWLRDKIHIQDHSPQDGQTFGDRSHEFWRLVQDMIENPNGYFIHNFYDMTTIKHAQKVGKLVMSLQQKT